MDQEALVVRVHLSKDSRLSVLHLGEWISKPDKQPHQGRHKVYLSLLLQPNEFCHIKGVAACMTWLLAKRLSKEHTLVAPYFSALRRQSCGSLPADYGALRAQEVSKPIEIKFVKFSQCQSCTYVRYSLHV